MLISLVVPVVNPELHIYKLFTSIAEAFQGNTHVELVIVNQSGASVCEDAKALSAIHVIEIMPGHIISAADARNLGAQNANGEFLFFLDDDALVHATPNHVAKLCRQLSNIDVLICQRGEIIEGAYRSHWKQNHFQINQFNFPQFVIEWNVIIRKSLFMEIGLFPSIGIGSNHAALSGEIFVVIANVLGRARRVALFENFKISHPSLYKPSNTLISLLGYYYGAGYAVGKSFPFFTIQGKIYWLFRNLVAVMFDLVFRSIKYKKTLPVQVNYFGYKLAKCRIIGFYDGIFQRSIKDKKWLPTK